MFDNSSITLALKAVKNCLTYRLKETYNIVNDDIIDYILKVHGLHKSNFDFIKNIEEIISSNLNDVSIDTNSNKNEKTMGGISNEAVSPINKLIGYRYLYREIKKLYGKQEAKILMAKMYDFSLAISDSTKIMVPYCYALDASKIVVEGRPFGQLYSLPPKRMSSFISAVNETVHQLSNHLAGALAIGSFFFDIAHLLIYNEKIQLKDFEDEKILKYIENCFQNFVHSVNHLSRMSNESPFTNISIFDKVKLKTFLNDMSWYFPALAHNQASFEGEWIDYVIQYIYRLQLIFMQFFDKGDPSKDGAPFRFPVCTVNISKSNNGDIKILDKDFIKDISKFEIYRYNIMVTEGSKIASCCRLSSDSELMSMGGQVNSFGGSAISLGSHRVVTINFNRISLECKNYDDYIGILNERLVSAVKILKAHKELIKKTSEMGLQPFIKNGWLRLDRMFSTIGVLGIVEANKTIKERFNLENDVIADSLTFLNERIKDLAKEFNLIINIEQIPGESMAIKLCEVDRLMFGEKLVPYKLYANQFIPLWEEATLWERMDLDGKYNKLFTGGSICHFNLGEKLTSRQIEKLINYSVKSGCEHFALNSVYSQCEDNHNSFGNYERCPVCDKQIVEKFTRIVGFMTPVSSWNKTRREWEFPQRKFGTLE